MEIMIKKFWNGEITLWRSYWLIGELLNALFLLTITNIEIYIFKNLNFSNQIIFFNLSDFNIFSKLIIIIWTIFITVGVWRAAENYKGNIIWIIATFIFLSYRIFSLRLILFN